MEQSSRAAMEAIQLRSKKQMAAVDRRDCRKTFMDRTVATTQQIVAAVSPCTKSPASAKCPKF